MKNNLKLKTGIIGLVVFLSVFTMIGTNIKSTTAKISPYTDTSGCYSWTETITEEIKLVKLTKAWGSSRTYYLKVTTIFVINLKARSYHISSQSLKLYTKTSGLFPPLLWGFDLYYKGTYRGESYFWKAYSPTVYDSNSMFISVFKPNARDSFSGLSRQSHIVLKYRWYCSWIQSGGQGEYSI